MTQRLVLFIVLITFSSFSNAQIKAYPIDAWHSGISFSTKFGGLLPVRGTFDSFAGTVLLDETDLTKTSATIFINTESIDTGVGMRDNHLKSADFFDVEKYEYIFFSSKRVIQENDQLVMLGELQMHGVSKDVSIPFQLVHGEQEDPWKNFRITLQGAFQINRMDFGVGEDQKTIGEEVNVEMVISARVFNTATIALFNRPFGQSMIGAFEKGGIQEARKVLKQLQAVGDKDASKPSSFEFLYLKLKQMGKAVASLGAAELFVELFPEESEAHSLLGYAYYERGQTDKAKDAFRKALEFDSNETQALEMTKLLGN